MVDEDEDDIMRGYGGKGSKRLQEERCAVEWSRDYLPSIATGLFVENLLNDYERTGMTASSSYQAIRNS